MTVKDYLDDLKNCEFTPQKPNSPSYYDVSIATTDIWSNSACKGYAIKAGERAGLTPDQIERLVTALSRIFDDISTEEAEQIYENGNY